MQKQKQHLNLHPWPTVHDFSHQWHEIFRSSRARQLLHENEDGSNQATCILRFEEDVLSLESVDEMQVVAIRVVE